jgi:hypothetical protein
VLPSLSPVLLSLSPQPQIRFAYNLAAALVALDDGPQLALSVELLVVEQVGQVHGS